MTVQTVLNQLMVHTVDGAQPFVPAILKHTDAISFTSNGSQKSDLQGLIKAFEYDLLAVNAGLQENKVSNQLIGSLSVALRKVLLSRSSRSRWIKRGAITAGTLAALMFAYYKAKQFKKNVEEKHYPQLRNRVQHDIHDNVQQLVHELPSGASVQMSEVLGASSDEDAPWYNPQKLGARILRGLGGYLGSGDTDGFGLTATGGNESKGSK